MGKKFLISNQYDELTEDLIEIEEFLVTEKAVVGESNQKTYLMGVSSPLLNVVTIGLYDQEDLMKKYPHGLVTESIILIPAEKFKKIKEKSIIDNKKPSLDKHFAIGNIVLFLNEYMLNFLEVTLNIDLSDKDKQQIENSVINILKKQTQTVTEDMIQNKSNKEAPEKTTNRELLKLLKGKGYYIEERLKNGISLEQDVKEILKNNKRYIEGIEILENKIKEVSFNIINENISIEEFSDIVDQSFEGKISKVVPLKIVNNKVNNLIKKYDLDIEGFINAAKEDLFPFMIELDTLQFKLSMEHIFKEVFYSNEKDLEKKPRFLNKDLKEIQNKFAIELVRKCDNVKKDYLINVITGYDFYAFTNFKLSSDKKKFKHN